jgi:hypothetical protein
LHGDFSELWERKPWPDDSFGIAGGDGRQAVVEGLQVGRGWRQCRVEDDVLGIIFKDKVSLLHAKAWHIRLFNGYGVFQTGA